MQSNVAGLPLSHKLLAWFETNKKPALVGVGVVAVLALIIWFVTWQSNQKQMAASDALSSLLVEQITTPGPHPDPAQSYLELAARYQNSGAGARALLLAAGSLFADGKYPEAQVQFEKFTRQYHDSPFLGEALLGVAACLDAQGKTDAALTAYKDLVNRHSGENVVPQAKFALGRIYVAQNKPELARDEFAEVERQDRFGSLGNEAGMQIEELIAKYPKLAPATPAPFAPTVQMLTNAPVKVPTKK